MSELSGLRVGHLDFRRKRLLVGNTVVEANGSCRPDG